MAITADELVEDFLEGMRLLAGARPDGAQLRAPGLVLNRIGLEDAPTNALHVLSPEAQRSDAEQLLAELDGLPYVIRARPCASPWVDDLAAATGHGVRRPFPIMVLDDLDGTPPAPDNDVIRVDPQDAALLRRVQTAFRLGNGTPPDLYDPLVGPRALEQPGYACYATLDGDEVTSVGLRLQGTRAVGVFGISTPPCHRRRGLGAAVTRKVVEEGRRHGASFAYLGASPLGLGIYERMGFRTVETWTFHVPG